MYRDGVKQSGLLVTVSCIWERLNDEHEVDVFQTARQLRFHRPELIVNLVNSYHDYFRLLTEHKVA